MENASSALAWSIKMEQALSTEPIPSDALVMTVLSSWKITILVCVLMPIPISTSRESVSLAPTFPIGLQTLLIELVNVSPPLLGHPLQRNAYAKPIQLSILKKDAFYALFLGRMERALSMPALRAELAHALKHSSFILTIILAYALKSIPTLIARMDPVYPVQRWEMEQDLQTISKKCACVMKTMFGLQRPMLVFVLLSPF